MDSVVQVLIDIHNVLSRNLFSISIEIFIVFSIIYFSIKTFFIVRNILSDIKSSLNERMERNRELEEIRIRNIEVEESLNLIFKRIYPDYINSDLQKTVKEYLEPYFDAYFYSKERIINIVETKFIGKKENEGVFISMPNSPLARKVYPNAFVGEDPDILRYIDENKLLLIKFRIKTLKDELYIVNF